MLKRFSASLVAALMVWGVILPTWSPSTVLAQRAGAQEGSGQQQQASLETNKVSTAYQDINQHWAQAEINRWSERGVVKGVNDQSFAPDRALSRAEWAMIINKAFQFEAGKSEAAKTASFADVSAEAWFATAVHTASEKGYMNGYNGVFNPNKSLTRQEAALSLQRLLQIDRSTDYKTNWTDKQQVAAWATDAVMSVAEAGLISGYSNGTFQPNKEITRAEAVKLLDRVFASYGSWYDRSGTFGPATGNQTVKGTVMIDVPGVTLQNTIINGDLVIGKGVGAGDVFLKNIQVKGNTYVYGGGGNSVHFDNSVVVNVIVNKQDGSIRLVAKGNTSVQEITLQSGAKIEAHDGVDVSKVRLAEELPAQSEVSLNGYFNTVSIEAYSISVQIPQGTVKELTLDEKAKGTTIQGTSKTDIVSLVLNAAAKIVGDAVVKQATVNAEGTAFDKAPQKVTVGKDVATDVKVIVSGKEQRANSVTGSSNTTTGSNQAVVSSGSSDSGSSSESGTGSNQSGGNSGNPNGNQGGNSQQGRFSIALESAPVTVEEAVYFTSPRAGTAYFTNERIEENEELLQIAVDNGLAKKVEVKANERTWFTTDHTTKQMRETRFFIIVLDQDGNAASEKIWLLDDATEPLTERRGHIIVGAAHDNYRDTYVYSFNRKIKTVDHVDLRHSVTISRYGGPFNSLTSLDEITVKDNEIIVKPYEPNEKGIEMKLLPNVVETIDTNEKNIASMWVIRPFTRLQVSKPDGVTTDKRNVIKRGEMIKFKINMPNSVYLLPNSPIGGKDRYDQLANNGWANRVVVTDDQVDLVHEMPTGNLAPGNYTLIAYYGHSFGFKIVD
ncbi:S-layer homology domain-containing protein [Paenibacillus sp. 481]|uniref:S-layer homology domain-containing protein n=1 Tax=Paenibacillus sp. 481 TaxID=2835869 RepID=UPI001E5CAC25|nr:S-layer homology domain-containing protein [Paenibacillus sp. 481]UHA74868.1 S-layer homology domain-containing protein [Paenibacillus sp. 481]